MVSGEFKISNANTTSFYGIVSVSDGDVNINCSVLEGHHESSISLSGGNSVWDVDVIKFSTSTFNFFTGSMQLTTDNVDGKDARISIADGDFSINCKSTDSTAAALFTLETSKMTLDSTYFTGCFTPIVHSKQCEMDLHRVKVYDCDAHVLFDGSETNCLIEDSSINSVNGSIFNFVTQSKLTINNLSVSHTDTSSFLTSVDSSVFDLVNLTIDSVDCEGILSASSRSSVLADGISLSNIHGEPFFKLDSSFMIANHITVDNIQSDNLFQIQLADLKLTNLLIKDSRFESSIFKMTSSKVDIDFSTSLLQNSESQVLISQSHCSTEIDGLILLPSLNLGDCAIRSYSSSLRLLNLTFERSKSPVLKSSKSTVVIDSPNLSQCHPNTALSYNLSDNNREDSLFQFFGSKVEFYNVKANQCPFPFIFGVDSELFLNGSLFERFSDNVIHSDRQSTLIAYNCSFEMGLKTSVISDSADSLQLNHCKFKDNQGYNGTGVFATDCQNIEIFDSEFIKNQADNDGGALHFVSDENHQIQLTNNLFKQNNAMRAGGAVFINYPSIFNISNNSYISNTADGWGDLYATNPRYLDTEFENPDSTAYQRNIIITVRDGYNQFAFLDLLTINL
ncbi:hypothetical protein GEMRC1_004067 [Eukaryota sp. GEM-RC1]